MKSYRLGLLAMAIALMHIALLPATSLAATRSWDGGGGVADTDWTTGANWVFDTVPATGDTAQFDRGAGFNYTVTFPRLVPFGGDVTTERLIVGSNTVSFELDRSATNYRVLATATDELGRGIIIGEEANDTAAVLTSQLSLLSTAAATLGHVPGSSGTLTLNENNDQFNVTGSSSDTELIIGRYGTGVLNVSSGADVNVSNTSGNALLAQYAGSSGMATIDGAGSTLSVATSLGVGVTGNGALAVTNGGDVISTTGSLGGSAAGTGSVTVTGAGSTWSNSGSIYVGGSSVIDGGNGWLSITNLGLVDIDGTLKLWPGGNVALDGGTLETNAMEMAGGTLNWTAGTLRFSSGLSVDPAGPLGDTVNVGAGKNLDGGAALNVRNGSLNVTGGSVLSVSAIIGQAASAGVVTIDGIGSGWTNAGVLLIGPGTLNIANAAQVEVFDSVAFLGTNGSVVVDNGSWVISRIEICAFDTCSGGGTLTIDGGELDVKNGGDVHGEFESFIRNGGIAKVSGTGSTWKFDARLEIAGGTGSSQVLISNGGAVLGATAKSDVFITGFGDFAGSVTVDGMGSRMDIAPFTLQNDLNVGGSNGIGRLTVSNGGMVKATNVIIGAMGEIHGDGNVVAHVQNSGIVSPGASPGMLNVDGNYVQIATGALLIELASASSYDQLLVTGDATLAGTLTVSLLDGFVPSPGQSFTILTTDDVDGTFDTLQLPALGMGLGWTLDYRPLSVVLTTTQMFPPGDIDLDGDVDRADAALFSQHFGTPTGAVWTTGDFDGDFATTLADLALLQAHLGQSNPSPSPAAVPEPAASAILIGALGCFAFVRRRRVRLQLGKLGSHSPSLAVYNGANHLEIAK